MNCKRKDVKLLRMLTRGVVDVSWLIFGEEYGDKSGDPGLVEEK